MQSFTYSRTVGFCSETRQWYSESAIQETSICCRLTTSLKLAVLHAEADSLDAAHAVLLTARRTAERVRSESNRLLEGSQDERFRTITTSRNHPDADVALHSAHMTDEEQILACMHADIVMLLADVALRIGVQKQAAHATRASEKKAIALQKRRDQVCISSSSCCSQFSLCIARFRG
jgi:hypothetical protein